MMTGGTATGSPVIHESAYVDEGARIGAGTRIWHFCHVLPGAVIGEVGILAETRRTATVRAIGDVELLGLSWQSFQETLERSDRADRDFAEIAKERIAYTP